MKPADENLNAIPDYLFALSIYTTWVINIEFQQLHVNNLHIPDTNISHMFIYY